MVAEETSETQPTPSSFDRLVERGSEVIRKESGQKEAERAEKRKRWQSVDRQLRKFVENPQLLSILDKSGQALTLIEDEKGAPIMAFTGDGEIRVRDIVHNESYETTWTTYALKPTPESEISVESEEYAAPFVQDGELFVRVKQEKRSLEGPALLLFLYDQYGLGKYGVTSERMLETATKHLEPIVTSLEKPSGQV